MFNEGSSGREGANTTQDQSNMLGNNTTTSKAWSQLSRIETKPPSLSADEMANPTSIAIHLLRLKNAAAQHGFLGHLIDPGTTFTADGDAYVYMRWIIESFDHLLLEPRRRQRPDRRWCRNQ